MKGFVYLQYKQSNDTQLQVRSMRNGILQSRSC